MEEERRAWMLFLSSSNYYVYMVLGLYKNLLDTQTKYPIYCGITSEVNSRIRRILKTIGLNLIELKPSAADAKILANMANKNNIFWAKAFNKLLLLDTPVEKMFDKIVYLDTDVQIFENIDDIFEYPHMAAIEDVAPSSTKLKTAYTLGCSKFCSGMFVWDFKNNPGKGHQILTSLPKLNSKIVWHDQNILNYFYQDWRDHPELHIPPEYGIMNFKGNMDKLEVPIKGIHYTGRLKSDWPFERRTYIKERNWKFNQVGFKEWVTSLAQAVTYFNKKYNLDVARLHAENLTLLIETEEKAMVADGRPNTYLYF